MKINIKTFLMIHVEELLRTCREIDWSEASGGQDCAGRQAHQQSPTRAHTATLHRSNNDQKQKNAPSGKADGAKKNCSRGD
jgi:hypothetical protein